MPLARKPIEREKEHTRKADELARRRRSSHGCAIGAVCAGAPRDAAEGTL